jgi:LacI family transcriptional regulator
VAVLGCDDNPLALGVSPVPISSVDGNCWGVGYAAAGLLARLVAGEPLPTAPIRVAARRVVARQSTATYAGAHPGVNRALQHLRQHFRRPLTMQNLARVARMSVRGLQFAFRQELNGTIQDELTRLRVAAAGRLLEETDLKLDAVAADTNLGDGKNLCRVFAKVHGVSPDTWRHRGRAIG